MVNNIPLVPCRIRAQFRYLAVSIPESPASPIRLDSYRHNVPLPPPEFDPLGYTNTDVRVLGTFDGQPFDIRCSVSALFPKFGGLLVYRSLHP